MTISTRNDWDASAQAPRSAAFGFHEYADEKTYSGTLAESKSAVDAETTALLRDLLGIVKVAVISGGNWPQFEQQLILKKAVGSVASQF